MNITFDMIKPRRTAKDGGEHMAVVGKTGTGKSTLARYLLPRVGALAIIDPKRDFKFELVDPKLRIFATAKDVWKAKPDRFVYRPHPQLLGNKAEMDSIYRYCFEHKNMTVYTDDMTGIVMPLSPPHFLVCCYTLGRTLGLNMISCFQRPASLPLVMLTECSKFAIFTLHEPKDIIRVRSYCIGYDPARMKEASRLSGVPAKHVFSFYDPDIMDVAEPMSLNLK